ncbi:MAG: hypothetical protein ACJAVV_000055 [Alphaproteobacteria bacterium]
MQLALAYDGIVALSIDVDAGDLRIRGKEGQSDITVVAKVFGEELSIVLNNVAGLISIEDCSRDLVGIDLRGDVTITDGSGDVNLQNIERNMK